MLPRYERETSDLYPHPGLGVDDCETMRNWAAEVVIRQVAKRPGGVSGFPTGSTFVGLYDWLIEVHRTQGLDFSRITTFNLDEYDEGSPEHKQSYGHFMWLTLFDHFSIDES